MVVRRALLITYYFPPSGGPGVQRALKFAKYLPAFGWQPEVLTVREGAYPHQDPALAGDMPDAAAVHRTTWWNPFRWYARLTGKAEDDEAIVGSLENHRTSWKERLALWIRANLFLPDARVGWVPFAAAKGRQLLRQNTFDVVLTSGPPHSVHLAGWALHKTSGVPWVADFRDPWTDINYYHELPHTRWAAWLDETIERTVLKNASAVTTVSPSWKNLLARKMPVPTHTRFEVVHNGYDAEDFAAEEPVAPEGDFVLTYVGSLYASRNPVALWKALRQLRERERIPRLRLRLVGRVDPQVERSLARHELTFITEPVGYVPHPEAVRHMQRSTLLLLVIEAFAEADGMITGKLYEYLAAGRPVLGIGPPEGDAARLLRETRAGRMFEAEHVAGITRYLREQYEAWEADQPLAGAARQAVQPYSRRAQTERLAELISELAATADAKSTG